MHVRSGGSTPFALAWLVLAAVLCALFAVWGIQLTSRFGRGVENIAAQVVPRATAAPSIVTDYTNDRTESTLALCAELAPPSATVTVETPTGEIISTIQCSLEPASSDGCQYSQSSNGMLIVISNKTGSLLTPAQAANCKN